jgi:hypothetical protein
LYYVYYAEVKQSLNLAAANFDQWPK